MVTNTALILTAIICLIIGTVIGYAALSLIGGKSGSAKSMESRLLAAETQLEDYQAQVTHHFQKTADLVNQLTASYRDVHEHLAHSAQLLANPEIANQFLEKAKAAPITEKKDLLAEDSGIEPPKDWSPEKGTLSESFGLDGKSTKPVETNS